MAGTPAFPNVPEDAVRAVFRTVLPDISAVDVVPLGKAFGHQSFLLTAASGQQYVVKIARIPAEVSRLRRTAGFAQQALAAGVATPRILHVGPAHENLGGRPFLIQEFLPGQDAEEAWPGMTAAERERFWADFGAATARLHSVGAANFDEAVIADGADEQRAHWPAQVRSRLGRLRKDNEKAGVLASREIDTTVNRLEALLGSLGDIVTPALVHRDLILRNALVNGGVFSAILDFEHARFSDPMMEFVALQTQVFDRLPGSAKAFEAGYRRHQPTSPAKREERFAICLGLELFGLIPYLQRNRQDEELGRTVELLRRWLEARRG